MFLLEKKTDIQKREGTMIIHFKNLLRKEHSHLINALKVSMI